jgi:hypothetical protein
MAPPLPAANHQQPVAAAKFMFIKAAEDDI